jgi:hypothetical protein
MALGTVAPHDMTPPKLWPLRGLVYPELSAPMTALRGPKPAGERRPGNAMSRPNKATLEDDKEKAQQFSYRVR